MASPAALAFGTVAPRDGHVTPSWHPERAARLRAIDRAVADLALGDALVELAPRAATFTDLGRVHRLDDLEGLATMADLGGGELDQETVVAAGSWETATYAAGLGLAAIDALRAGEADAAFVAPRPPGHHAGRGRGMGFCLINNVAVAAAALIEAGERVAIVDWDVHHGNGTQDIFWDDPRVLYVSLHESPAWPGTGSASEVGGPRAAGLTVNVPLPRGTTGDAALHACDDIVAEVVDQFDPTWVLVSAGYDAHRADPMADLAWSAGDFGLLTKRVMAYAPGPGRTIAFLEGGYDLDALADSVAATLAAFTDAPCAAEAPTSGGPGMQAVDAARRARTDRLEVMA
jgi:acetoin utilization deacetylase AcuC-like enzyme